MDESKPSPPASTACDEACLKDTGGDTSPSGKGPNGESAKRSSTNQSNETMTTKDSGKNKPREDVVGELCKDGITEAEDKNSEETVHPLNEPGKVTKPAAPEQDVLPVDDSIIEKLTMGFLQTFLPQAEYSNAVLDELMRNQRVLIETLEQENAKFKENKMMSELSELMTEAKKYHSKLVHLRKEMMSLHDKSTKLKKRAVKLQHHKMKLNLQKEQQREREMEQEKHLIAKPATKKTP
ncbi:biogenesis of lysosome-related organelles complex 1 subunit 6-like isoform X2 [Acanthaster planci]|uniref:Biogenesis of lysosome-related organelles complex 1 subunit 6-like isoform X2 n=1 Tax=Acanthaster planci TaxID=133434 RepID=A0A8B7XUU8_ACAPL|nr:biogenesis of lysosome-related organelles complex 1 subunit 6-like isoform X2 [Acanthaster planci]